MDLTKYSEKFVDLPCNLCKSNDYEVLSYEKRFTTNIPVVICKKCGLIYLNPRWTIEAYQEFYEKEYRNIIDENPSNLKDLDFFQRIHGSKILSFCGDFVKNGDKILDIGCACGGVLYIFKKSKNCMVYGIEPNIEHAEYTRNNLQITVETNCFENVEYLKESFDLIILSQTINHLYNPMECLEKMREILKSDGKIFIEVQNYPEMVKRGWNPTQVDHIYYFTPETLECMVRKAGFELLNVEVDTKQSHEAVSEYMKKRTAHIHIRMLVSKSIPEKNLVYPEYKRIRTELESYLIKKNSLLNDIFLRIKSPGGRLK